MKRHKPTRRSLLPEALRGSPQDAAAGVVLVLDAVSFGRGRSGPPISIHALPVRLHQLSRVEPPRLKGLTSLLTDNERQVLTWLSLGKRCCEIAPIMGLKENAVNQIMYRIKNKIGCNTLAGAVAKALRQRLIE